MLDLPGQSAKFNVWIRAHTQELGVEIIPDAGRGDGEWPAFIPGSSNGGLTVGCEITLDGFPAPDHFRGEAGTVVVQFHTDITATYPVVVERASFIKKDKETGTQQATFVLRVTAAPTFAGFGGSQATAAAQSFADKEHWSGVSKTYDPQGLQDGATQRWRWWGTGDNDSAENTKIAAFAAALSTPVSGLKLRPSTMRRLSASVVVFDTIWGLTDTAEDVINAATAKTIDPQNLASQATTAAINGTPATPTGATFLARGTTTKELNDNKILSTTEWGLNSTKTEQENARTHRQTDAAAIDQAHAIAVVYAVSGSPSAPTTPAGMVLLDTDDVPLNPEEAVRIYRYAYVNRQTAIEVGKYELAVDPNGLTSSEQLGVVWDSTLDEPATPAAPAGLKFVNYRDVGIDTHPNKQVRVFRYALTDSVDDLKLPKTYTNTDPEGLESRAQVADVNATPSLPAGFTNRGTTVIPVGGTNTLSVVEGGLRTTRQDIEFPGTYVKTDVSGIEDVEQRTVVTNSASLSFPTNSGGLYLCNYQPTQITNSGLYRHEAEYRRLTPAMAIEHAGTRSAVFPNRDRDDAVTTVIANTNTASVIATALLAANTNSASFDGADVRRLTPAFAQQTIHTADTRWELEVTSRTYGDVPSCAQLLGSGTVQLYLADVIRYDTTRWIFRLGYVPVRCTLMELTLYKRYTGGTLYAYPSGAGTTNSGTFFGLTARCVTFAGIEGRVRVKDSYRYPSATNVSAVAFEGARRIGHKFHYDSRGIILGDGILVGQDIWTTTDLTGLAAGSWVNASSLGLSVTHGIDADYNQTFLDTTP